MGWVRAMARLGVALLDLGEVRVRVRVRPSRGVQSAA